MERKQCADCGEANLQSEVRCWACGSAAFTAEDVRLAGERTICVGTTGEATLAWQRERTLPMPQLYVLCAAACALFTCVLGYWIGRASAPSTPPPMPESAQTAAAQPIPLPRPPAGLVVPTTPPPASAPGYDPAVVTVRQKPVPAPRPQPRAGSTPRPSLPAAVQAPGPVVLQNEQVRPRQQPRVVTEPPVQAAPVAPRPAAMEAPIQAMPLPSPETAVVMLRNNAREPVEISIEGNEDWRAVVAAGSSMPVTLPPGSYRLQAEGAGATSKRSTLALGANRRYSLVIEQRQEGGRASLVLVEPAIDGVGG